jgi:Fungal specific transcription factor domain
MCLKVDVLCPNDEEPQTTEVSPLPRRNSIQHFETPTNNISPLTFPSYHSNLNEALNVPPPPSSDFDPFLFDLDAFALFEWNVPLLPVSSPLLRLDDNHALVFDDFDRSRLAHDLKNIPMLGVEMDPPLPVPAELTRMIKQYFEYVSQINCWFHVSSFSVRTCPTDLLLLLLAIGDVFSTHKTLERWARVASAYLMQQKVEEFENFGTPLPFATMQALSMYVCELAYSGDPQRIARSMRYRVCLASACRDMLREEREDSGTKADENWMDWIKRESRRRALFNIHHSEHSIELHLGFPSILKLSDFDMPLPCSNEVWFARSEAQWQELYFFESHVRPRNLRYNKLLSGLLHDSHTVVSECRDTIHLASLSIVLFELICMTRRLVESEGENGTGSQHLLEKTREALDAWKTTWESVQMITKGQYLALMSEWCSAEIYLGAPDFILKMLPEISMRSDSILTLAAEFVRQADLIATDIDPAQFNSTLNACAAALHYIETIAEFTSFADCLFTLRASVIPSVMGSIFLGGLCLWFSLKVIRIRGRSNPATEEKVVQRFRTALSSIRWGPHDLSATDDAFIVLLGNLIAQTQVWGIKLNPNISDV